MNGSEAQEKVSPKITFRDILHTIVSLFLNKWELPVYQERIVKATIYLPVKEEDTTPIISTKVEVKLGNLLLSEGLFFMDF